MDPLQLTLLLIIAYLAIGVIFFLVFDWLISSTPGFAELGFQEQWDKLANKALFDSMILWPILLLVVGVVIVFVLCTKPPQG